jgi:hypothetical protein
LLLHCFSIVHIFIQTNYCWHFNFHILPEIIFGRMRITSVRVDMACKCNPILNSNDRQLTNQELILIVHLHYVDWHIIYNVFIIIRNGLIGWFQTHFTILFQSELCCICSKYVKYNINTCTYRVHSFMHFVCHSFRLLFINDNFQHWLL